MKQIPSRLLFSPPVPGTARYSAPSAATQNKSARFETDTNAHLCSKLSTPVVLCSPLQVIPQFGLVPAVVFCALPRVHMLPHVFFFIALLSAAWCWSPLPVDSSVYDRGLVDEKMK
jgi:hypothetical protein